MREEVGNPFLRICLLVLALVVFTITIIIIAAFPAVLIGVVFFSATLAALMIVLYFIKIIGKKPNRNREGR